MAYATWEFYQSTWGGTEVTDEASFAPLCNRASDAVDSVTGYVLQSIALNTLPQIIQTLVSKATCAQVDYLADNGIETSVSGSSATGFTVGKVSVSGETSGATSMIAPAMMMYIEQTGLISRAVPAVGHPFAPYPIMPGVIV